MRIIIGTTTPFHLGRLAAELSARGNEVTFYSYYPRWRLDGLAARGVDVKSLFFWFLPWTALALARSRSWPIRLAREMLFALTDYFIAQAILKSRTNFDVYIGLSTMAVKSAQSARNRGATVIVERGSSHIETQLQSALAAKALPPSIYYIARERASYRAADHIMLLSSYAVQSFAHAGENMRRIHCIVPGINTDLFCTVQLSPSLPVRAITVGPWSRRKGADILSALAATGDVTLTHIGTAGDVPFPPSPNFRSLGHLPHAKLVRELQHHHLFLFASRDDGFGMVMAEALACGLHLIGTQTSGAPDLQVIAGKEYVTVIKHGCLLSLTSAIRKKIDQLSTDSNVSKMSTERRECLSQTRYGDEYNLFLEKLVSAL